MYVLQQALGSNKEIKHHGEACIHTTCLELPNKNAHTSNYTGLYTK